MGNVTGNGHRALAAHSTKLRDAGLLLAVDANPRHVLSDGYDQRALRTSHTQDWFVRTPNDEQSVIHLTLRVDEVPDDRRRAAIDAIARRHGGTSVWRIHSRIRRSYALLEITDAPREELAAAPGALYETPIIALAVSPTVAQALPYLQESLGGDGRPAAVLDCRKCGDALLLEWNLDAAPSSVILGLIDVELRRFASGRQTELLNPLPPHVSTRVAAEGLGAPEIQPQRVLDLLLDDG